ncbi:MAG: hypothetical protein ACT4TC_12075 [Myxococcaceae bacterium]
MNRCLTAAFVTLALSAVALAQEGLPANHPPTGKAPPLTEEVEKAGLPANHPPMGKAPPLREGAEVPPNHPPVGGSAPPLSDAQKNAPPPASHPPMSAGSDTDTDELLKQFEAGGGSTKDKTFEVAAAVGKLYFKKGRYQDAAKALAEADQKAAETRSFFLAQRKKAASSLPAPEEAGCPPGTKAPLTALLEAAKEKAKAGQSAAAAACARAALEPVLEVEDYQARAAVLTSDSAGAAKHYDWILQVDDRNEAGLYGKAALLLDTKSNEVKALGESKKLWERYLAAHPRAPRTPRALKLKTQVDELIAAGGATKWAEKRAADAKIAAARLPKARPPMARGPFQQQGGGQAGPGPLSQEMVDAVRNTERTPELEQGLAKLVEEGEEHLAHARFQDALDIYKRVVPFQPENGRAKAGMAWALVGLQRQPMADNIWSVAVRSDVSAVDKLGDTLKSKGDAAGAKALWTKLAATSPDYAPKLQSKLQ